MPLNGLKLQIRVDESICRWWDCRDKTYVSSASYINKMSHYCGDCFYDKEVKTGEKVSVQ
jgi:hypothetical protein